MIEKHTVRNKSTEPKRNNDSKKSMSSNRSTDSRKSTDGKRNVGSYRSADSKKTTPRDKFDEKQKTQGKKVTGKDLCPYYKKCGGCQYQDMPYVEQLKKKQFQVNELLRSFGKVDPIIGMQDPLHYRNKVHAVFDRLKDGTIISGIYQANSHRVISVDECKIENQKADEIMASIRSLLKSCKIKIYNEISGFGLFRHALIRTGYHSGEVMVVLVMVSTMFPSKKNFVAALRKLHPEITTIVLNVNDKDTNMVLGDREQVLFGKGYIEDTLCGCKFRISPKSFYQVNPVQTEVLYNKAIEYAELTGNELVVDAYCGIGTIGLIASEHAKEVIGVELNPDAVRDAKNNARLNNRTNVTFYNNDAGKFMVDMAEQGIAVDVVFMDPPRSGSTEEFIQSVQTLAPKKVVYISCNPETLARDLKLFTKNQYKVTKMTPVDMFPMTEHVETVVLMSRVEK